MSIESLLLSLEGLRTSRTLSLKERQEVLAAIERLQRLQELLEPELEEEET